MTTPNLTKVGKIHKELSRALEDLAEKRIAFQNLANIELGKEFDLFVGQVWIDNKLKLEYTVTHIDYFADNFMLKPLVRLRMNSVDFNSYEVKFFNELEKEFTRKGFEILWPR